MTNSLIATSEKKEVDGLKMETKQTNYKHMKRETSRKRLFLSNLIFQYKRLFSNWKYPGRSHRASPWLIVEIGDDNSYLSFLV